ncbi:DsbA family protein [Cytobacillus solani]|uniref:DsbA family protein n=1 Tax=Cytobacillus solani TaxID=1637975 RepID=UPI0006ABEC03|nr:thioredoxin domain-containing protein [Cytobacillus solani]KOP81345.1 hypothetical protein AMS60_01865 [Bacillus sp. FJAT-21945]
MNRKSIIWLLFSTVIVLLSITLFVFNDSQRAVSNNIKDYKEIPSISGQPVLGSDDAPIVIVEFGDYKCPSCKNWKDDIFEKLNKEYIKTGKVKFSYINVLFHGDESIISSLSAEYVNEYYPEKYWEYHNTLYNNQEDEFTFEAIAKVVNNIAKLDEEKVSQALADGKMKTQLQKDIELGNEYEIQQTPTIFINNFKVTDPFNYSLMKKIIEKELEKENE